MLGLQCLPLQAQNAATAACNHGVAPKAGPLADRLKSFVANHVAVESARDLNACVADYGNRVDYFNNGIVKPDQIRADKEEYFKRWPKGNETVDGEIQLIKLSVNCWAAKFKTNFHVDSGTGRLIDGQALYNYRLQMFDGKPLLIAQKMKIVHEQKSTYTEPSSATRPVAGQPWTNSLGVKFVPAGTDGVLFSVWDVRVKDYAMFVKATGHEWPKPGFTQTENDPAVMVSWDDAHAFCDWLTKKEQAKGSLASNQSYRLPTDAEWSKAVGLNESSEGTPGSKSRHIFGVYPWGTQYPPPKGAGNYAESLTHDGYANTSPVGSFTPNQYGLYDMGGNVDQWCEDKLEPESNLRVLRGGAWSEYLNDELLSSMRGANPGFGNDGFGFRVVMVLQSAHAQSVEPTQLETLRSHYSQAQLATDEPMREKYILELTKLRALLFAETSDEWWKAVDTEIIRHPAPINSDSKSLAKALVGQWGEPLGQWGFSPDYRQLRSPPNSPPTHYLYRADGTWALLRISPFVTYGTWSIQGNQLHETWTVTDPPHAEDHTIILINADHFIITNGTQVFIQRRLPDSLK